MAKTLLLIDDSSTIHQVFQLIYTGGEVEVVTESDPQAALSKAGDIKPDVIVVDVSLPGMDGYDLCRKLKENPSLSQIPVVLMGSSFHPVDAQKARDCGAVTSITKPFSSADLKAKIEDALTGVVPAPAAVSEVETPEVHPAAEPVGVAEEQSQPDISPPEEGKFDWQAFLGESQAEEPPEEAPAKELEEEEIEEAELVFEAESPSEDFWQEVDSETEKEAEFEKAGADEELLELSEEDLVFEETPAAVEEEESVEAPPFEAVEIEEEEVEEVSPAEEIEVKEIEAAVEEEEAVEAPSLEAVEIEEEEVEEVSPAEEFEVEEVEAAVEEEEAVEAPPFEAVEVKEEEVEAVSPAEEFEVEEVEAAVEEEEAVEAPSLEAVEIEEEEIEEVSPAEELEVEEVGEAPLAEPLEIEEEAIVTEEIPIPVEEEEAPKTAEGVEKAAISELPTEEIAEVIRRYLAGEGKDIIERVVWEVVPDLAELLIRQEIERLKEDLGESEA